MASELFVRTLLRAEAAVALAILLVLALRAPARRLIGPALAYRLWALVLVAAGSSLFPTLAEFRAGAIVHHAEPWPAAQVLAIAWLVGAAAMVLAVLAAEIRFRRLANRGLAGPAIVGVAAPRLVTPYDYHARFTPQERAFIRRHERTHLEQNHPLTNAVIAGLQVLGWFNPLVHLAAAAARFDQELACDFLILEGRPKDRRVYGEALLKAQLGGRSLCSPLSCAWSRHPLEVRLRALASPELTLGRYRAGFAFVGAVGFGVAMAIWTGAPAPS